MKNCIVVYSSAQLKQAIESEHHLICVTDGELAENVLDLMSWSKIAISVFVGIGGVAAFNAWNPLGWGSTTLGLVAAGSRVQTIVALGMSLALIYALYSNYRIKGNGKVKLEDGSEISGELILEKC